MIEWIKNLIFEFDPVPIKAIIPAKARYCPDCNCIVEEVKCPVCASKTYPVMGLNLGKK